MKIEHKELPFYHIELKNVFTESELKKIIQKIVSLKNNFKPPEDTGSAVDERELLKKNKGILLHECGCNIIQNNIDNVLKDVNKKPSWKNLCFKRIFNKLEWGSDLVQCYENSDYYKPHVDDGIFTLIIWIYDGKKSVDGGDLYFPEYDYLHPCENNNGIIFFSKELHGVTTLNSDNNFSRYSITSFGITTFSSLPKEKSNEHRTLLKNKLNSNLTYN